MNLTFINSPAKLLYLAEETDAFSTAWARFRERDAELLVVRRRDGELAGLGADQLQALLPLALASTVGSLALKHLAVLSHRATLAEILAELSRGAEGVVLTEGPKVVSVVLRPSSRVVGAPVSGSETPGGSLQ
jgi:hypothetical protein